MISKTISMLPLCFLLTACLLEDNDEDSPAPVVSSEEISITGGQIQSTDDRLTLGFPDGALAANTEITIRQLTDEEIAEKYPDLGDIDFVYELGPDGYIFLEPIEVTYLLPADADIPRALVSFSNGISENLEDVVYDPETGTVTGMLSHFSDAVGLAVDASFDYPTSLEHFVNDPPSEFTATAEAIVTEIVGARPPGTIGGDSSYAPRTASGTDRYITINSYSAEVNTYDTGGPPAEGSATISYTCNEQGIDSIQYRFIWTDPSVAEFDETISGSVILETEVTCIATTPTPEEEEPLISILTSVIFEAGEAPEAIKKAGSPPYDLSPENTLQRFIVSGTNLLTIVNLAGVIIDTFALFSETYGTLYLQHSTGGDFYFGYGPNGRFLCPMEEGVFCESEFPTNANTTSAEYGVDANGDEVFNEVYRVKGGRVLFTQEQGQFWQEEDLFDDQILNPANGLAFNLSVQAFAYEPLTPTTGVVITEDGRAYFIDRNTNEVTLITSTLGSGLRDIACDQFSSGEYGCAIQSFTDATITACAGSSEDDFTCGEALSAGDGVSLGVAVTDEGNLAIAGGDFTDSSIHAIEVTPSLGVELHIEIPIAIWVQTAPDLSTSFDGVAHLGIDPVNDALILSGNGSDNAAILDIDELAEFIEITDRLILQKWMD